MMPLMSLMILLDVNDAINDSLRVIPKVRNLWVHTLARFIDWPGIVIYSLREIITFIHGELSG